MSAIVLRLNEVIKTLYFALYTILFYNKVDVFSTDDGSLWHETTRAWRFYKLSSTWVLHFHWVISHEQYIKSSSIKGFKLHNYKYIIVLVQNVVNHQEFLLTSTFRKLRFRKYSSHYWMIYNHFTPIILIAELQNNTTHKVTETICRSHKSVKQWKVIHSIYHEYQDVYWPKTMSDLAI